jgi:alpha-tubulin suppressor-like RCC1 family protein
MRSTWLRSMVPLFCAVAASAASGCGDDDSNSCAPAGGNNAGTSSGGSSARGGTGGRANGNGGNETRTEGGEPAAGGPASGTTGGRNGEPGTGPNGTGGDDAGLAGGDGGSDASAEALRWIGPCTPLNLSDDGSTVLAAEGIWTARDGWQTLPDLPGGDDRNTPVVMSGDGRVVYGSSSSALGDEIYRWTRADGTTGLGQVYTPSTSPGDDFPYALHTIDTTHDGLTLVGFGTFLGGDVFRWTPSTGFTDLPFEGIRTEDAPLSAVLSADGITAAFTGSGGNGLPVVLSTTTSHEVSVSDGTATSFPTAIAGDGSFVSLFFSIFGGVNGLPVKDPDASPDARKPALCLSYGETCVNTNVAAFDLDGHATAAVGVEYLGGMGERNPIGTFYWSAPDGIWHLSERLLLDGKGVDVRTPSAVALSADGLHLLAQGTRHEADGSTAEECFIATLSGEHPTWNEEPTAPDAPSELANTLALGGNDSCVVDPDGGVRCWGQITAEASAPRSRGWSPLTIDLPGPAAQVSVGTQHACALLRDGTVQCWGDNSTGQLGDGTTKSRSVPKAVPALTEVTQVAANEWGTCALLKAGSVKCWGHRVQDVETETSPVVIDGLKDVIQLVGSAGYTCALLSDATTACWGEFYFPFAETYSYLDYFPAATAIPDLDSVTQLAAGAKSICALRDGGEVTCWGSLPHAFEALVPAPSSTEVGFTKQTAPTNIVKLGLAENVLCALLDDGTVQCAGWNQRGLLGTGDRHSSLTLRSVLGLAGAVDLALGGSHACARLASGSIRCWGSNDYGQLGVGTVFTNEPASVSFPASVVED